MSKQYDLAVFITRAQPFHNGHLSIVNKAHEIAKEVLVLIGSANASPSTYNPFNYYERVKMINSSVDVQVGVLDDYIYEENQWLADVQYEVNEYTNKNSKICIIGHSKDESSYYLKHFPQWDFVDVEYHEVIDATQIRELMFQNKMSFVKGAVPGEVFEYLYSWINSPRAISFVNEYEFIKDYKASWAGSPYPPIFQTVDAVVVQSGHILLIQRGEHPGNGLWALPGGFLNANETLNQAVVRELREETKLKIPEKVLQGSIIKMETFDAIKRSTRGRTITRVFMFQLDDNQQLPKVKGSDDAKHAEWIPLAKFYAMAEDMFEDHYHIIRKLLDNM